MFVFGKGRAFQYFFATIALIIKKGMTFTKYKQFVDNCFKVLPRQALHAETLGFIHPETNKFMSFSCSLPSDLADGIEKWRGYAKHAY